MFTEEIKIHKTKIIEQIQELANFTYKTFNLRPTRTTVQKYSMVHYR